MAKDVTLADIAARVGVSNVAVSKALSGKPGVSNELRAKIKSVAEEMGYVMKSSGKSSCTVETGNIGVIIPEHYYGGSITFYGQLYEKVVRALFECKYYGILELLSKEDEKRASMPMVMQDEKVDGLILLGQLDEKYIDYMIQQTELPVFFLDTYITNAEYDAVISDGYYGMYTMTNYLIHQGHREIGFVGSTDSTSSIADRFWGYRKALRENHIRFDETWEIPDRDEHGKTYRKILPEGKVMGAYACNCDFTAYTVIQNLEERGYRVPEDVSVIGFDNFLPVGMDARKVTSYEVDMERMAELCVRSLIKKIKGQRYTEGIQIVTGKPVLKHSVKKCE